MKQLYILIISSTLISVGAFADQNIEIVGGNSAGNPKVAVIKFTGDSNNDQSIADIITNDLNITGEFNAKEYNNGDPIESTVQYIISGNISSKSNASTFTYTLTPNTESGAALASQSLNFGTKNLRKAAHIASNTIYKQLTNTPGIFTSKIAYIIQNGNKYQIVISDYDGYNQQIIFSSHAPIISLAWNADGSQLAYASYESGKPVVYVQDLYKPKRYVVANFSGSNSSPVFAPNGKLAVTLTKDNGSHIYLVNNGSNSSASNLISYGSSIDTEADIAKNGNVVFTSNHDNGPQIFMSNLQGSKPVRLTINMGNYNTTPRFSHDGTKITFINRNGGTLKTYVMDLTTKSSYPISMNTGLDVGPSFAPNDKLVLFSSGNNMYIVNTTGTTETKLNKIQGSIIDQRWANNF